MFDLVLRNCKVVEHDGIYELDLGIRNGKIAATMIRGEQCQAAREIDVEGRYVLPGAIDTHSHIGHLPGTNQPRPQTQEENFCSESISAVIGGTTSAMNYIFTQGSIVKAFEHHQAIAKEHAPINMFFHGSLMNDLHLSEIETAVAKGLRSFKIFLPYKGEEALRLGGLSSLNDGQLIEAFERLRDCGGHPIIHAENPELIDYYMDKFTEYDRQDMAAWEATRPGIVEGEAVEKVVYLSKKVNAPITIAHVSSWEAVEAIEKEKGRVLLETTPHYLTLTAESNGDLGPLGKVSPPVRHAKDRDKLWEYIFSGLPTVIGSDHNAWQKQHKRDMWEGLAGLPGNAYILPLIISEGVFKRGLPWSDVVRITSYTAATKYGLYPNKGNLRVGADADIVVMDTGLSRKVKPEELKSIVDYSPYEDYVFPAWPNMVIRAGNIEYSVT